MHFLLDTNICIYLINNRPPGVLEKFKQHPPSEVAISTITLFELEYRAEKSNRRQQAQKALKKFLSPLDIVDLDQVAAKEAAVIRAQLEKKGTPIGPYDILIAGLARSRSMTLVTTNTKEFSRIDSLFLENWTEE